MLATYQQMVQLMSAQPGWINLSVSQAAEASSSASSPFSPQLEKELGEWIHEGKSFEQIRERQEARREIMESINNGNKGLYLDSLSLGSLPDIFTHNEIVDKFDSIQLHGCDLESIPPSLLNHANLTRLDIVDNSDLSELPEIGDMSKLEQLNLSKNGLDALPESLGKLSNLRELKAAENELKTLPNSLNRLNQLNTLDISGNNFEQLSDLSGLTELKELNLNCNPLTDLPDSLRHLPLQKLSVSATDMTRLPDVIPSLPGLQVLDVSGHDFSEAGLPAALSQLQMLRKLTLVGCKLTSLPEEITHLPQQCRIDVSGNQIPREIITNLAQTANGPSIIEADLSNDGSRILQSTKSLETNVEKWLTLSQEQKKQWQQLGQSDDNAKYLNTWLENMEHTGEYCNLRVRGHLKSRMTDLLDKLTKELSLPPEKREMLPLCIGITDHATSTCVDQIAMGLDDMETAQTSLKTSRGELSVGDLLAKGRDMFISELVKKIADKKVDILEQSVNEVDELEVHLAYKIGIMKRLGLPLGSADMRFENLSHVEENDLDRAERNIRKQLNKPEPLCEFLSRWDPMSSYLKKQYPEQWRALDQEFENIESEAFDSHDWQRLNNLIPEKDARSRELYTEQVRTLLDTEMSLSLRPRQRPATQDEPPAKRFRVTDKEVDAAGSWNIKLKEIESNAPYTDEPGA